MNTIHGFDAQAGTRIAKVHVTMSSEMSIKVPGIELTNLLFVSRLPMANRLTGIVAEFARTDWPEIFPDYSSAVTGGVL